MRRMFKDPFQQRRKEEKQRQLEREVKSLRAELSTVKATCRFLLENSPNLPQEQVDSLLNSLFPPPKPKILPVPFSSSGSGSPIPSGMRLGNVAVIPSVGSASGVQTSANWSRSSPSPGASADRVGSAAGSQTVPPGRPKAVQQPKRSPQQQQAPQASPVPAQKASAVKFHYNVRSLGVGLNNISVEGKNISIINENGFGTVVIHDKQTKAANGGRWYYAIKIVKGDGAMQVGWATEEFLKTQIRSGHGVGDTKNSWGIDMGRLKRYHGGNEEIYGRSMIKTKWRKGDIVGCGLDLDSGVMEFFLNSCPVGSAFRISPNPAESFYPAVSVGTRQGLVLTLDQGDMPLGVPAGYEAIGEDLRPQLEKLPAIFAGTKGEESMLLAESLTVADFGFRNNLNKEGGKMYAIDGRRLYATGNTGFGSTVQVFAIPTCISKPGKYYFEVFISELAQCHIGWKRFGPESVRDLLELRQTKSGVDGKKNSNTPRLVFQPGTAVLINGGKGTDDHPLGPGARTTIAWRKSQDTYAVRVWDSSSRTNATILDYHADLISIDDRATSNSQSNRLYKDKHAWTFDPKSCSVDAGNGGEKKSINRKIPCSSGSTVGCLLDLKKNTISWMVNGTVVFLCTFEPKQYGWVPVFGTREGNIEVFFQFDKDNLLFAPTDPEVKFLEDLSPHASPTPFYSGDTLSLPDPIKEMKQKEGKAKEHAYTVEVDDSKEAVTSYGTLASKGQEKSDPYADIAGALNYDDPEACDVYVQEVKKDLEKIDPEEAKTAAAEASMYGGPDSYMVLDEKEESTEAEAYAERVYTKSENDAYADIGELQEAETAEAVVSEQDALPDIPREVLEAQRKVREEGLKKGDWNSRFQAILETLPSSIATGNATEDDINRGGAQRVSNAYGVLAEEKEEGKLTSPRAPGGPAERDVDGARLARASEEQDTVSRVAIATLVEQFWKAAAPVARKIIEEFAVPAKEKTYKPFGAGGLAGGEKYKVGDLFFKFANDWQGIYKAHEFALKAANREMLGLRAYLDLHIKGLHFPLVILVDYLGHRLICSSLLPLTGKTLVYGSDDQGRTVKKSDKECNRIMEAAGRALNLKGHVVAGKNIFSCGDIEVHRGLDGRLYLLDTARVFPPQAPSPMISVLVVPVGGGQRASYKNDEIANWRIVDANKRSFVENVHTILNIEEKNVFAVPCGAFMAYCDRNARAVNVRASNAVSKLLRGSVCLIPRTESLHLFEMLRPELVKASPSPLSSDAWSRFGLHNHQEHNLEVQKLSSKIIEATNNFVQRMKVEVPSSQQELISILHNFGLNCRFLGRIRSAVNAEMEQTKQTKNNVASLRLGFVGQMLLTQMIARVFKSMIRRALREIGTSEKKAVVATIVKALNTAIGVKIDSENLPRFVHRKEATVYDWKANVYDSRTWNDLLKIKVQMKYGMRSSAFTQEEMSEKFELMSKIQRLGLLRALIYSLGVEIKLEKLTELSTFDEEIEEHKQENAKISWRKESGERFQNPLRPSDVVSVEPVFRSLTPANETFAHIFGRHVGIFEAEIILEDAKNFKFTQSGHERIIARQNKLLPRLESLHAQIEKVTSANSLEASLSHIRVSRCYATLAYQLRKHNRKADPGDMRLGDNHGDQPLWMALAERAVERVRKGLEACRNAMKKEIDAERKDSGNEEKDSKEHQLSYPLTVLINSETVLGLVALTRGDIDLAVDMLRNAYENLLVSFDDLPVENKKTRYRGSSSEDHLQLGGLCPAMIRVAALYAEALLVQQSSPGTPLVAKSEKEKIGVRFTRALRVFPVPIGFKSPELLLTFEEAVLGPGFPAILRFESERQYSPINSSGANGGQLQHLLHGWRSVVQFKQRLLAAGGKVDPTGSICSVTMSPSKDRKAQLVPPSKEAIANWLRKIDMADYLSGLEGYATDKLLGSVKVKWTPQDASGISDQNVPRFSIQKSKELWSWGKYRPSRRTLLFEKFTLDLTVDNKNVKEAVDVACVSVGEFGALCCTEDGAVYKCGPMADNKTDKRGKGEDLPRYMNMFTEVLVRGGIRFMMRSAAMRMHKVVEVSVGRAHAAMRTLRGMVFTFGEGKKGQLGHGNTLTDSTPRWVESLRSNPSAKISCGFDFTLSRTAKGEVFAFGNQEKYALGVDSGKTIEFYPVKAKYPQPIKDIAAGSEYHIAVGMDGTLFWCGNFAAFGSMSYYKKSPLPVAVLAPTKFASVSAYEGHCAAIDVNDRLYTWGKTYGKEDRCALGRFVGGSNSRSQPAECKTYRGVSHLAKVSSVFVSGKQTFAISAGDRLLFGCGYPLPYYVQKCKVKDGSLPYFEEPIRGNSTAMELGRIPKDNVIDIFEETSTSHTVISHRQHTYYVEWIRHRDGWSPREKSPFNEIRGGDRTTFSLDFSGYNEQHASMSMVSLLPPSVCQQAASFGNDHVVAILSPPVPSAKMDVLSPRPENVVKAEPCAKIDLVGKEAECPPEQDAKLYPEYFSSPGAALFCERSKLEIRVKLSHVPGKSTDNIHIFSYQKDRYGWKHQRNLSLSEGKMESKVEIMLESRYQVYAVVLLCGASDSRRLAEEFMKEGGKCSNGMVHFRFFGVIKDYKGERLAKERAEARKKEREAAALERKRQREQQALERKARTAGIRERMRRGEKPPPGGWAAAFREATRSSPKSGASTKPSGPNNVQKEESPVAAPTEASSDDPLSKLEKHYESYQVKLEESVATVEVDMEDITASLEDPSVVGGELADLKNRARNIQMSLFKDMSAILKDGMKEGGELYKEQLMAMPTGSKRELAKCYSGCSRNFSAAYRTIVQRLSGRIQKMAMASAMARR